MRPFIIIMSLVCLVSGKVNAQFDYVCPQKITTIENNVLADELSEKVSSIYKQLGCITDFEKVPTKRSLLSFNRGQVDGEVFRHRIAEHHYTVDFVRSQNPIVISRNILWKGSGVGEIEGLPIGYVRGVLWQEAYLKKTPSVAFSNYDSLFSALERGAIKVFLASDTNIKANLKKGTISLNLEEVHEISKAPLYHYLHKDFTAFMAAFDAAIIGLKKSSKP